MVAKLNTKNYGYKVAMLIGITTRIIVIVGGLTYNTYVTFKNKDDPFKFTSNVIHH